jgi:hypothetical protein
MTHVLRQVLGIVSLALVLGQPARGQTAMENDAPTVSLGSVQVDTYAIGLLIAYAGDAAVLTASVTHGDAPVKYVPLFASTYRGIPLVTLDVLVSQSKDAIWVQSSWPDNRVLAYYRLGAPKAITPFGDMALLDTPMPQVLSGGPVPFPAIDPLTVVKKASFYYQADE